MNFEEFKNQALVLLREAEGKGLLGVDHPIASKKRELQRLFMQGLDDGAERSQRLLQLKRLGFGSLINQWTSYRQSIEEWEKLFDEVENITGQEAQKVLEEEEKEKEEEKERQEKREERGQLVKQPKKALTISERAVNYLYGQLKMKGIARFGSSGQELNYKLMWAVDFLSSELSKQCGFDEAKKDEMVLFKTSSDFFGFLGDVKDGLIPSKYTFVDLQFKATEVRKWLGFTSNEMSIKDVVDLFRGLQRVIFEAEGEPILRDAEKNEWVKTTVSDTLYSMKRDNLGIVSNRWKTKDVILNLRFQNIMSWLFIANLSCGKKGLITLPKNARHELDGYGQNILRWLRLWKKPRKIIVSDLASIAGLKYKEAYRLIIALERILDDLKDKSYIKDFEATGKGKNTRFVIVKDEKL